MSDPIHLSIVIVNFNNDRVLRPCLDSLPPALEGIPAEVILSDNGSTDGSVEWVRKHHPEVRVLENRANLGFAEANNRAFALARGAFVLLLNPDCIVVGDAFRPMLELLEKNPHAGAVGCKLLAADGARHVSARAFPLLSTQVYHLLGLDHRFRASRRFGRFHMTWWDGEDARRVDWVCGAALMIRREILETVGPMDPYFFLTYDEVDWCRRMGDAGYEVWYTPDAEIVHLDAQSAPQSDASPEGRLKLLTVERNSRVHYFVRHHGLAYAVLVELALVALSGALWAKARLLGSRQSQEAIMEKRLLLVLYARTLRRVPRALHAALRRRLGMATERHPVLVNPYLEDAGSRPPGSPVA